MLGIVFTTTNEAAPFIRQHTNARTEALEEDAPLQTETFLVAVTGKGKIKATLATERLLRSHDPDVLLHTGTCTALNEELDAGTMIGASFVLEGDRVELDAPTYPRMPLDCPFDLPTEGTLVSQDHQVSQDHRVNQDHVTEGADERSYWERLADVRDETGYPVAYVAAQHGVPCHIAKAVDTPIGKEADASSDAQSRATEAIASFLQRVVENRNESAN